MNLFKPTNSENWYFSMQVDGRQVRRSTGTPNKREAAKIAVKMAAQPQNRRQIDSKLFSLAEAYLDMASKRFRGKAAIVRRWLEVFGDAPLANIRRPEIEHHVRTLHLENGRPASAGTKNRHLAVMRAMMNQAVAWGMLESNPCDGIKKEKEQDRMRYLKREEVDAFILGAPISAGWQMFLRVAVETGMRLGELFELKWSDLDFEAGTILVRHSKNDRSRVIPMTRNCTTALKQMSWGWTTAGRKVWPVLTESKARGLWLRTRKAAGMEDLRFHDLRHTFAVIQRQNGLDLQTLQEIMGHRSIAMTLRYSKFQPEDWMEQTRAIMNRSA